MGLSLESLTWEEARSLECPFFEEEVFSALSALNEDKAPGTDEFTMAFRHLCWDFVKSEVLGFFKESFYLRQFERILNTTVLVLIPKNDGAYNLKDFKPISLVRSLYKFLAKVLANRLKKSGGKGSLFFSECFYQRETNS